MEIIIPIGFVLILIILLIYGCYTKNKEYNHYYNMYIDVENYNLYELKRMHELKKEYFVCGVISNILKERDNKHNEEKNNAEIERIRNNITKYLK